MLLFPWSVNLAVKCVEYVLIMQKKQQLIEIIEPENTAIVLACNYTLVMYGLTKASFNAVAV